MIGLDSIASERLCLTLLHSLWQVALLALAAWGIGRCLGRRRESASYIVHATALVMGLVAAPITHAFLSYDGSKPLAESTQLPVAVASVSVDVAPKVSQLPLESAFAAEIEAPSLSATPIAQVAPVNDASPSFAWQSLMPWLAGAYLLGVALMLTRLAWSAFLLERLRVAAQPVPDGPVFNALASICNQWSLKTAPVLAHAEQVVVPKVVGLLKPTILLPSSALTGLPIDDLELILAHELAHVRRHDLWINLLQRLAEAILFFNPAMWWLSRRVSTLREYCCDDRACALIHDGAKPQLRYAEALLHAVELQHTGSSEQVAALAVAGRSPSELRRRVARLFGEPIGESIRLSRSCVAVLLAGVALLFIPPTVADSTAQDKQSTDSAADALTDSSLGVYTHKVSILGRITDEEGNAIAGAKVYLASRNPGYRRIAEALSDSNGRYRFDNASLPIKRADTNQGRDYGVFEVFAIAEGRALGWRSRNTVYPGPRGLTRWASSDPNRPSLFRGDQPIELDIALGAPQGFQGRVVDHLGNPIAGASLAIRYCDTQWNTSRYNIFGYEGSLTSLNERDVVPATLKSRKTDEEGRFAFDCLPSDYRWEVELRAKGYPHRDIWVVTNDKGPEASKSKDDVTIYRGNAEVTLDETREVVFRVLYGDTGKPANRVGVAGRGFLVTTDERGLAKTRLPRKEHSISLVPRYKSSYLRTRLQLDLSGEESGEPFTYRIDPAAIVDITVVDENTGEPLADVDVWWDEPVEGRENDTHRQVRGYRSWEVETRISHYERLRTDEHGKVRVLFPDGEFRIGVGFDAYPEGYQSGKTRGQRITCKPGEPTSAVFKLKPVTTKPRSTATENEQSLRVSFVGPDGKPVSRVGVELRGLSDFDQSQIKIGEFVEKQRYGVKVRTNASGQLMLGLGKKAPRTLGLHIKEPGYGPYWANWDSSDHPEPIPSELTVQLERGWSVGGIVVDEAGQPIANAKVRPSIEYKKRPGDTRQMRAGARATTAADGSWQFDSVPESYKDVSVEITHPNQSTVIASLARGSYEVAPEGKPAESIVMQSGLVVAGRVTDSAGQPVVGATVRTKFHNDVRKATTNDEGKYQLVGCKPKMARIVVSAPGKAMELAEVRIDPDMEPVDFVMQPGGKIRIKVVDENGIGVPKARIFFQSWRGRIDYFEFDHVNQYANDQGIWEWSEAPLDEFEADICRPGGMQLTYQKLQAGEEEYVFSPPSKLSVSGKVVDAETGAPIEKFRVVRGLRNKDARIGVDWIEDDAYEATDGAYRVSFDRVPIAAMVRVEALGYRVKTSRDIQANEGKVAHDFELERQSRIASTILAPDGKPAAEAKIAVGVAGSQISITNGDIDDGQTYAQRLSSDAEGQFELPSRDDAFQLVITHDEGFAHLKSSDGPIPAQIKLTPWARAEGVFRIGANGLPPVHVPVVMRESGW